MYTAVLLAFGGKQAARIPENTCKLVSYYAVLLYMISVNAVLSYMHGVSVVLSLYDFVSVML